MSRVPTAVLAGLTLVVGFAVAQATGVRALGGAVLLAGVAWCAVRARSAGRRRVSLVVLTGAVCFVASHLLAPSLGAWPSVVLVALVLAAVTYVLVDRSPSVPAPA
jgi:Ca2+/Na+ antiporter